MEVTVHHTTHALARPDGQDLSVKLVWAQRCFLWLYSHHEHIIQPYVSWLVKTEETALRQTHALVWPDGQDLSARHLHSVYIHCCSFFEEPINNSCVRLSQWLPRRKLGSGPSCQARNNLASNQVRVFNFMFLLIGINEIITLFSDDLTGTGSYGIYSTETSASTFSTNFASLITTGAVGSTQMLFSTGDHSNVCQSTMQ